MQDLTTGPISRHLLKTTAFMLVAMVFQTLYFLVDLYWVGRLGTSSVAAVGIAGNLTFIVLALSQMLGVGTTTLVSHATGRKDHTEALLVFNQAQVLALLTGILFFMVGTALQSWYASVMGADGETARLAAEYLHWFIPAMALQFALVAMGAALRGIGSFKPGMVVSSATIFLNLILAPILIFGWGTGHAFGVAGAAIASLISIIVGIVWLTFYFVPADAFLRFVLADWKPRLGVWKRILAIGTPAGFEFALIAAYLVLVYVVIRPFGAAAQAGFGIGQRIVQSGMMPVIALGFAVAPVAGQNVGAKLPERVKATIKDATIMAAGATIAFAFLCNLAPAALMRLFSNDPAAIAVGVDYLKIISWNFVAAGIVFVNSSMFQALGNTIPSLIASLIRITLVAIPVLLLARLPSFRINWIWYVSVGAVFAQLACSLLFLRRELRRKCELIIAGTRTADRQPTLR